MNTHGAVAWAEEKRGVLVLFREQGATSGQMDFYYYCLVSNNLELLFRNPFRVLTRRTPNLLLVS
jgi:hypothetical protein